MSAPDPKNFTPPAEQMALFPDVSGNTLNGLGESELRPPSLIYWHSPKKIAHGALQQYMLRRTQEDVPEVTQMRSGLGGRGAEDRAEKPDTPLEDTATGWSAKVKAVALENEADLVGIAQMDRNWLFEGYDADLPWMIVLGVAMDHAELATAPEPASVIEVMRQYNRGTRVARALADFILEQGYDAIPHGGPQAGPALMIPAALEAGFGELGKHGSIINRHYGASFRLACVITDLPLIADKADIFGADDFCTSCQICARACPVDAIAHDKQMVRGSLKWYIDFDKCITYFNESYGCGICIAECPFSRPEIGPRLVDKVARRWQEKSP